MNSRQGRLSGSPWPCTAMFALAATYLLARAPDPLLLADSNDQGYQMALGMALATGRLPCFDVLTQYGPLVAVASWIGFALTGGAVGELCIDALGYAAAITLAFQILRAQGYTTLAMLAPIALRALALSALIAWARGCEQLVLFLLSIRDASCRREFADGDSRRGLPIERGSLTHDRSVPMA